MDHDHRIQCLDALRTHQEQASKLSHVIAGSVEASYAVSEPAGVVLSSSCVGFDSGALVMTPRFHRRARAAPGGGGCAARLT